MALMAIPYAWCACGHPPRMHAPLDLGAAGVYYGRCILCDECTVFIEYRDSVSKQEIERGAKKMEVGQRSQVRSLWTHILRRLPKKKR